MKGWRVGYSGVVGVLVGVGVGVGNGVGVGVGIEFGVGVLVGIGVGVGFEFEVDGWVKGEKIKKKIWNRKKKIADCLQSSANIMQVPERK